MMLQLYGRPCAKHYFYLPFLLDLKCTKLCIHVQHPFKNVYYFNIFVFLSLVSFISPLKS